MTLCILMALIAFGNAMVDYFFFDNHLLQLSFCLSGATLVSVLSFIWLPHQMACCNFYMFISSVLYVSLSGAQVREVNSVRLGAAFSLLRAIAGANLHEAACCLLRHSS